MPVTLRGYADLEDVRIHYEITGSGPNVLLLHGNGEDLRIFETARVALSPHCRTFALDTRGHGRSTRGDKPLQFDTLAGDVAGVMDALSLPRAHIVGYSDGASTAMHLALSAPDKVESLILLGANYDPKGISARYQLPVTVEHFATSLLSKFNRKAVAKHELLELMVHHPQLSLEQLRQIQAPTLVVTGSRDIIKPEHTAELARAIPNAHRITLAREDHFSLPKSAKLWQMALIFWEF